MKLLYEEQPLNVKSMYALIFRKINFIAAITKKQLGHSKSIISFWSPQLSQVHAGGRVVRTMRLLLIELKQEEAALKPDHRGMPSKPQSTNHKLCKYTRTQGQSAAQCTLDKRITRHHFTS